MKRKGVFLLPCPGCPLFLLHCSGRRKGEKGEGEGRE